MLAVLLTGQWVSIIAVSRNIDWHRIQIDRHCPTDVFVGRVLARAIVREMKTNPDFQKDSAEAKLEIAATQNWTAAH